MISICLLAGCNFKTMEIHNLGLTDSIILSKDRPPRTHVTEYYVVTATPFSTESLISQLLRYSKSCPVNLGTSAYWVERNFYRETSETPRDFGKTLNAESEIQDHNHDFLANILHSKNDHEDCWYVYVTDQEIPSNLKASCVEIHP